jgi:hypothetical protein
MTGVMPPAGNVQVAGHLWDDVGPPPVGGPEPVKPSLRRAHDGALTGSAPRVPRKPYNRLQANQSAGVYQGGEFSISTPGEN